ncbi:MAG: acyltransferase family protein [Bacteroidales bacterium]
MERNRIIDIAKGIGIMLVVYTHTKCYAHDAIYLFIMPLFFALSGYFFNEERPLWDNIKVKFKTLIIPYIFYFILLESLFIILHKFFYQDVYFAWGMFIKPYWVVGPMWFFYGLFFTSIFFALIAKSFKNIYIVITLSVILGLSGYLLSVYGIKLPVYIDSALSMTLFYCFGYLLKKFRFLDKLNTKSSIIIGIVSLLLYLSGVFFSLVNNTKPNEVPNNYLLFIISACSAIVAFLLLSKLLLRFRFISNLFSFYGKNSLIVFVWHFFTFYLFYLLFNVNSAELSYIDGFLITIFALVFSIVLGLIQQKYLPIPNIREIFKYVKKELSYLKR